MKVPASYHQERLWFIDQFEAGNLYEATPVYHNIPLILELEGPLDVNILKRSIKEVISRHEALRTRIITDEDKPFQLIDSLDNFELEIIDFIPDGNGEHGNDCVINFAMEKTMEPFLMNSESLIRGALIRAGEYKSLLCLTLHHLIADKYSLEIITREITKFYESFINGKAAQLPALPIHYADFSHWQRELPDDAVESLLIFWNKSLQEPLPKLELPTDYPRAAIHTYQVGDRSFTLPGNIGDRIRSEYSLEGINDFVILLAAFNLLLSRYSGQDDIIVGIREKNRHQPGTEEIVGPVANLMALRSNLSKTLTFPQVVEELNQRLCEISKYVDMPFDKLVLELNPDKDMSRTVLFDVLFQYEVHPTREIRVGKLSVKWKETNRGWGKYDLNLLIRPVDTSFEGILVYNKIYFSDATISRFIQHYQTLLENIAKIPDQDAARLPILSNQERDQLLVEWNQTRCNYPKDKTIHQIFVEQVEKTPDHMAVGYEDSAFTYSQLEAQANHLANYLKGRGIVDNNDLIAVMMDRSEWMIIVLLGILKAGGAYLPVDPNFPKERLQYILADSNCRLLVIEGYQTMGMEEVKNEIAELIVDIRTIAKANRIKEDNPIKGVTQPDDSAYVIYTSGTTGYPKGCIVSHRNVVRLFKNDRHPFDFHDRDVWIMAHSFCFDFSVWEMYGALLNGGKLVVPSWDNVRDVSNFCRMIKKHRVSVLNQTPGAFYNLIEEEKKSEKKTLDEHLRYVCFGGEKLDPNYLKGWLELYSLKDIKLVNMFGITETTVHVTYYEIKESDVYSSGSRSPIGLPLPETTGYVYDKYLSPVPIGVKGELFVGGSGVSKGYLNNIPLTSQRFIENPNKKGEIIYKTGDIGRWLPDSTLEYLGRNDDQVKIRGYRVEPGEIETGLLSLKKIKRAVVVASENLTGNKSLAAYFTAEERLDIDELRGYLKNLIPAYMIPAYFIQVDTFPLTATGKIDKKALPEPDAGNINVSMKQYQAPRNPTEEGLVDIWQEVLGLGKIGINDDFFALGGDSLKGIRVINRIQERLHEIVHVAALFQAPTVMELAAKLDSYRVEHNSKIDAAKIALLRRIIKPLTPLKGMATKNPPAIFILSPYRSGSTLLRIILSGHPKLFAPPELELLSFNKLQERKAALSDNFLSEGTLRAIKEIKRCDTGEAISIMQKYEAQDMTSLEFYGILQQWLGDKFLVDKTPSYTFDFEILKRVEDHFENPKYIHLLRHPYAATYSFIEAKIDQVIRYKHHFSPWELAELLWVISHQNTLEFLKTIPRHRKHTVKFEDLVSYPDTVVRGICDFLDLQYDEQMIRVYDGSTGRMTDGIYSESKMIGDVKFLNHSTINEEVADNWKKKHNRDFLGDITYKLAESFGYLREDISPGLKKIAPAHQAEYYELSYAQRRLWILNQFEEEQISYNLSHAYELEGESDRVVLEKSFETLIKRHESLRTTFITVEGEPKQKIHDFESVGFKLEYIDLREEADREKRAKNLANREAAYPFDLKQGPLVRTKLIHLDRQRYLFLFTLHHIVSDGWSMNIVINELLILYNAYKEGKENPLSPLRLQYKDYSAWQTSVEQKELIKRQEQYWLEEFKGEMPLLHLPTDYPRPEEHTSEGDTVWFILEAEQSRALNHLALNTGVTLFMMLVSIYTVLLSKLSGQEDIVVGFPTAGREHLDLEAIIGMFVNLLALRNHPKGDKTFKEFLQAVKKRSLQAFENQEYKFEELVQKLGIKRDFRQNPLFDVTFTLQNMAEKPKEIEKIEVHGLNVKPYETKDLTAKFDIDLACAEVEEGLLFNFEYRTKLFKRETIERFCGYLKKIISSVINNIDIKLMDIQLTEDLAELSSNSLTEEAGDFGF